MPYRMVRFIENRIFEWFTSITMLLIGSIMLVWPEAIERGLFRYVLYLFEDETIELSCLTFSLIRIAALLFERQWVTWSPCLRIAGAIVGGLLWGQMGASVA